MLFLLAAAEDAATEEEDVVDEDFDNPENEVNEPLSDSEAVDKQRETSQVVERLSSSPGF